MLSTHEQPGYLRHADNLVPTRDKTLAARPSAFQVIDGQIDAAESWGTRLLLEKQGRLTVWDGVSETDIAPAGLVLSATPYQTLTQNAERENRLYIADGARPLWYIAYRNEQYVSETVLNTVRDSNNIAYPIPIPRYIASWRNRLWLGDGGNRIQHCQNEGPATWDPLWTQEFQTNEPDGVRALLPDNEQLIVGLGKSIWNVAGDSQFNWKRNPLDPNRGVAGPHSLASADQGVFVASQHDLSVAGTGQLLSGDIEEAFSDRSWDTQILIDEKRRLLLLLLAGRLFVMHIDNPGLFGEISNINALGLIKTDLHVGWYGADGLWLLGYEDEPDKYLDGTRQNVVSVYDTWEQTPHTGRSKLPRVFVRARGSARGTGTYTLDVDGKQAHSEAFTLTDQDVDTAAEVEAGTGDGEYYPTRPVNREFTPHTGGTSYRHKITADCHIEIVSFDPRYTFRKE